MPLNICVNITLTFVLKTGYFQTEKFNHTSPDRNRKWRPHTTPILSSYACDVIIEVFMNYQPNDEYKEVEIYIKVAEIAETCFLDQNAKIDPNQQINSFTPTSKKKSRRLLQAVSF